MASELKLRAEDSNEDASRADLFEIPPGWTWSALGDAATFINGDRSANYPKPGDFVSNGVAFVNTGHIEPNGRLSHDRLDYISRECFDRLRSGRLAKGDIVYCLRGSTIGKTARVDLSEGSVASSLVIIRAKPTVSQEYLYYFLVSPLGQSFVRQHENGSAQPNLSVSAISRYPISLPPIAEQNAIAAVLGALDDKIELNRRMNATLEAMARALFQSWFVDFDPVRAKLDGRQPTGMDAETAALFPDSFENSIVGTIPRGWEVGRLDDVLILQRGFDLPTPDRTHGKYPVIAASGTNGCHDKFMVKGPGVTTGRSGVLGKVFFIHGDFWPLNTSLWVKEFKRVSPAYAFQLLRGLDFEMFNSGSAVPTLNRNHVHNLPVVIPTKTTVTAFDAQVMPLMKLQKANKDQSRTLATLRDTLLPKLLSGELSVAGAFKATEETIS